MPRVNLALQGGGSHGAFTWGVLDRLLSEPGFEIDGISGTSAGAVNAAALVDGYEAGGREGARAALEALWRKVADRNAWSSFGTAFSPLSYMGEWLSHFVSPYQFNPSGYNALQSVLEEAVDWPRLRCCQSIKLFVSATNVLTNRLRIFTTEHLSAAAVAASACLPQLYQAVEIDGEYFWDGGFMGNPTLEPLLTHCDTRDVLVVQVNPKCREAVPQTPEEISDRTNEITFNASLMREIRGIAQMTRVLDELGIADHRLERAYFHLVDGEDVLATLSARSKMDTNWAFLTDLRDKGWMRAAAWLERHRDNLGNGSTLDLSDWAPPY